MLCAERVRSAKQGNYLKYVFHRCLCSTSYHVKHYLRHVSERLDENKIKFFSTDFKYIFLPRGSIEESAFQKSLLPGPNLEPRSPTAKGEGDLNFQRKTE